MSEAIYTKRTDKGILMWKVTKLWHQSKNISPIFVNLSDIHELEENCWFIQSEPPTCRNVAEHAARIYQADLNYPIILSADGDVMDGMHRVAKAWILGLDSILAVRFTEDPEPDTVLDVDDFTYDPLN